jgi:membrane protein
VPELREEAAPAHRARRDRLQGIGVVQDRQPSGGKERNEVRQRNEVREQDGIEDGEKDHIENIGGRGAAPPEERGLILGRAFARVRAIVQSFADDECTFLAGAVAYQIFFALIPLLALLVGVLAFAYGADQAERELVQILRQIYPSATAQETRIAHELVQGRALSLSLGVIGTLFSTMAIHGSLESALAAVLGREGRRAFLRGRLEAAGFVGALAVLALVSFGLSFGVAAVSDLLGQVGLGAVLSVAIAVVSPLVGLAIGFLFFYLVYLVLPRRRVGRGTAASAAVISAVLWEVAKLGFGFFTRALGLFAAYGPLAFAAGLLTSIYVTAVIILIGAEVIKTRGTA